MTGSRSIRLALEGFSGIHIEDAAAVLRSGGIVLYPSDTVYGLACRAGRSDSVGRLAAIKGYGEERPFIVLAGSLEMARDLAVMDAAADELARENWPGPFSIVLQAGSSAPRWVCAADGTIALRIPADPLTKALLQAVDCPLVSTSANTRGRPATGDFAFVEDELLNCVDLALDGGTIPPRAPSRIVRMRQGWVEILR